MVTLSHLLNYLNTVLSVNQYVDYCPNGLQVEGCGDISTLVTGVTASYDLIEAAVAHKAHALLVHHGYFWKGDSLCLTGMHAKRIRLLMQHNIHLLAYHLPLDAHQEWGNNVTLAQRLGVTMDGHFPLTVTEYALGFKGYFPEPLQPQQLSDLLTQTLGAKPVYLPGGDAAPKTIKTVGWCTGAAQDFILDAAQAGLDAYITGEVSERTAHQAKESGIHFYAAGHHATERYGVQALGAHLVKVFPGLTHHFIDIPNPV